MGAGMSLRALALDKTPFSGKFVFHNATIGSWLDDVLDDAKILAYHEVDPDHMREAVFYKHLKKMNNAELIDNDIYRSIGRGDEALVTNTAEIDDEAASCYYNPRSDFIDYKDPSPVVMEKIISFLHAPIPQKAVGAVDEKSMKTAITKHGNVNSRFSVAVRVRPGRDLPNITSNTITTGSGTTYNFSRVLPPTSTIEDVRSVITPILKSGGGGIVFAYGQTGSGKTYTITQVIDICSEEVERGTSVSLKEVYNGGLIELLEEYQVESKDEFSSSLEQAIQQRKVRETMMNEASSRSHMILTVTYCGDKVITIVDLAGSERNKRSMAEGMGFAEARAINKSLLSLIRVLHSATDEKSTHIPFRDDPLTSLLAPVFSDDINVALFACVSPDIADESETKGTVEFASGATYVGLKKKRKNAGRKGEVARIRRMVEEAKEKRQEPSYDDGDNNDGGLFVRTLEGDRDGVDVLFLHYYGGECIKHGSRQLWSDKDLRSLQNRIKGTTQKSPRLLLPDFPGHGRSRSLKKASSKCDPKSLAKPGGGVDTVLTVMSKFCCDPSKTIVCGFDWGGGVALTLGRHHPERCVGLVIWNGSYRPDETETGAVECWRKFVKHRRVLWTESVWHDQQRHRQICNEAGVMAAKRGDKGDEMEKLWRTIADVIGSIKK